MRKGEEDQNAVLLVYGRGILMGGAGGLILCVSLLFLTALAISGGMISVRLKDQIIIGLCVVGSFFGALLAVRSCPARGTIVGITVGSVLFLLQLTLGLLLYDSMSLENGGIGILCADLFGGAAAGVLGGGGKRKGGKGQRRRRR